MSAASGIAVADALSQRFGRPPRLLHMVIRENAVVLEGEDDDVAGEEQAFRRVGELAADDAAAYFLLRRDGGGAEKFTLLTWMPEGRLKVRERMVYASTQDTLRRAFGDRRVAEELHYTTRDDMTWEAYSASRSVRREDVLSTKEKHLAEAHAMEETARAEQSRSGGGGAAGGGGGASGARGGGGAGDRSVGSLRAGGIGGFHAVRFELTDEARAAVRDHSWVELAVDEAASTYVLRAAKDIGSVVAGTRTSTVDAARREMVKDDARYYVWRRSAGNVLLVYCCPRATQRRLRMVYSTAKQSLVEQLRAADVRITKSLEVGEVEDLTNDAVSGSTASGAQAADFRSGLRKTGGAGAGGGKAAQEHGSLASFMGSRTSSNATTRKKIVRPPDGAYG